MSSPSNLVGQFQLAHFDLICKGRSRVVAVRSPRALGNASAESWRTFLTKMSVGQAPILRRLQKCIRLGKKMCFIVHLGNSTIYTDEDIHGICDENLLLTCEMVTATLTKQLGSSWEIA